mgnify:CR=1 FL=1
MAKKEKMVDLKSKPKKITKKELEEVQDVINDMNRMQIEVGSMESRKLQLLFKIDSHKDKLNLMQQTFGEKYGTFDINITDGTINYPENGKAN